MHLPLHLPQNLCEVQLPGQGLGQIYGKLGLCPFQLYHFVLPQGLKNRLLNGLSIYLVAGLALGEDQVGVVGLPSWLHRVPPQCLLHPIQDGIQVFTVLVHRQHRFPLHQAFQIHTAPGSKG